LLHHPNKNSGGAEISKMTSRAVQDVFLIGFVLAQFVAVSGLSAKNPGALERNPLCRRDKPEIMSQGLLLLHRRQLISTKGFITSHSLSKSHFV
jgi:hypothetical protein